MVKDIESPKKRLEKTDIHLASLFKLYTKRFKKYAYYATYYDLAMDLIADARRSSNELELFIKQQENVDVVKKKRLNFQNLMIEPIQRLPRYKMLIVEMIKANKKMNKKSSAETLKQLEAAMSDITDVLKHINETVRLREKRHELRKFVMDNFYGRPDLIRNCRLHIYNGYLTKNRRSKKLYKFFLFTDILVYGDETVNKKVNVHRVLTRESMVVLDPEKGRSLSFMIKAQSKAFEVIAEDWPTKKKWLSLLEEEVERGQKPATQLSIAPIWTPDQNQETCSYCTKKFTVRNRRHHCRVCGKLVCAACSTRRRIVPWLNPVKTKRICEDCYINLEDAKGCENVDETVHKRRVSTLSSNPLRSILRTMTVDFSQKLEGFLDFYGRTIFDSLVDVSSGFDDDGKESGVISSISSGSRQKSVGLSGIAEVTRCRTHKERLQITVALFLQTVETIRFYTKSLQHDFVEHDDISIGTLISRLYTSLWSCFPEYYSRLPESLIILGEIKDNAFNTIKFKDITGHESIKDVLLLAKEYLKEFIATMETWSKKLNPVDEEDFQLATELLAQTLALCAEEERLGNDRVDLRNWQKATGANFYIQRRGRKLLKEDTLEKLSLSVNGVTRSLKFSVFSDMLVYRSGTVKKTCKIFWLNESQVSLDPIHKDILLFTNQAKSFKIKFKNPLQRAEWQDLLAKDMDWWMMRRNTNYLGLLEKDMCNDFCGICFEEFTLPSASTSNLGHLSSADDLDAEVLSPSKLYSHCQGVDNIRKAWPETDQTSSWTFSSTKKFQCSCCEVLACDVCSHQFQERNGCLNIICARCKISGLLEDSVELDLEYDREQSERKPIIPHVPKSDASLFQSLNFDEDSILSRNNTDTNLPETPSILKSRNGFANLIMPDSNRASSCTTVTYKSAPSIHQAKSLPNALVKMDSCGNEIQVNFRDSGTFSKKRYKKPPPPTIPPPSLAKSRSNRRKGKETMKVDLEEKQVRKRSIAPPPREGRRHSTGRYIPPPPDRSQNKLSRKPIGRPASRVTGKNSSDSIVKPDIHKFNLEDEELENVVSQTTSPSLVRDDRYEEDVSEGDTYVSKVI